jgi:hypothetical protein
MRKVTVKGSIGFAILLCFAACQGCFQAQRAMGCNNTGILGCKDEPSEIQESNPDLQRAPPRGRFSPRYQEGQEQPWTALIDACMAAGGQRSECIEKLPPEVLIQLEAWESANAAMRREQLEGSRDRPEY